MPHHLQSSHGGPSDIHTRAEVRQQYHDANLDLKEVEPHGLKFVHVDELSSADKRSTAELGPGEESHVDKPSTADKHSITELPRPREEAPDLVLSPAERPIFDKLESWDQILIRQQPEDAKSLIALAAEDAKLKAEVPYLAQDHRNVFYWTPNGALASRTYADALQNRFPPGPTHVYPMFLLRNLRRAPEGSPAPLHTSLEANEYTVESEEGDSEFGEDYGWDIPE